MIDSAKSHIFFMIWLCLSRFVEIFSVYSFIFLHSYVKLYFLFAHLAKKSLSVVRQRLCVSVYLTANQSLRMVLPPTAILCLTRGVPL